jgi:type I restriction enzyme M protein
MQCIAPPEKDTATDTPEKRPWDAADQFRANSGLKPQEYTGPVLCLIFLRFAEVCLARQRTKLGKGCSSERRLRRQFMEHRACATGTEAI